MRLAYLILAHRSPEQVGYLARTLVEDPSSRVYIHVDSNADEARFAAATGPAAAFVRPRFRSRRAGFSLVRATLAGLRAIQANEDRPYYAVLLSGQDFPTKPLPAVRAFYESCTAAALMDHAPLRPDGWNVAHRVERYWFHDVVRLGPLNKLLGKIATRALPERVFPMGSEPYGGSQWWSMRDDAVDHVLAFVDDNPAYSRFFRFTSVPDEVFFHSILLNSPLKEAIDANTRRFQEFRPGSGSPRTLTAGDVPGLIASSVLFARKWDDLEVVRALSSQLRSRGSSGR